MLGNMTIAASLKQPAQSLWIGDNLPPYAAAAVSADRVRAMDRYAGKVFATDVAGVVLPSLISMTRGDNLRATRALTTSRPKAAG